MGIVAAFDKVLFFNEANKYCVLRLKTADDMIPADAKSPYRYSDHLIRFTAVGYDLPRTNAIQIELDGVWQNALGETLVIDSQRTGARSCRPPLKASGAIWPPDS